ncbi:MAG: FAD-dependent oxidoreductase [Tepidisphaeraceae bacterium]
MASPAGVAASTTAPTPSPLYASNFSAVGYGNFPPGWLDLIDVRPSRNWAVDGNGCLRPMLKKYTGLIVYDGALASGEKAGALRDAAIAAAFTKTPDPALFFGLVTRLQDGQNYYAARFTGDSLLELVKFTKGERELMSSLPSMQRYPHGAEWKLELAAKGDMITAILRDESGLELARVDAKDETFKSGRLGLTCSTYSAAKDVQIRALQPFTSKLTAEQISKLNAEAVSASPMYPVLKPVENVETLNTSFDKLADSYDVIVAGAGTGGSGAAIQAARMGAKVLLLEETDWIGGQMSAAGVTAMDEASAYGLRIVRERGMYREFHESMATYYYTLNKDPFRGDRSYGDSNTNAGYEPKIARAGLYAMIADARSKATLDLSVRSRVVEVAKSGNTVTGVTIEVANDTGTQRKKIQSKVLIDATEYGDVIPLTGARYRVGNVTSDKIDPKALVQDHTWCAVIREYPQGVPDHLKIHQPPPDYGKGPRAFLKYRMYGGMTWGKEAKDKIFQFRVYTGYRSVPDTTSPLLGEVGEHRNTLTSLNGGNDYPTTVATIEDLKQRYADERGGIYRSLSIIYYLQNELGAKWSVAEEQGYDTPANRAYMAKLGIRPDLMDVACRMPPLPYVRESRRIMGIKTLVASDLTRFKEAKHFDTSVAMADYFMDLHGTEEAIEKDLDPGEVPKGGGPFQVPFETFIPETIDGFLPAEKNISQSRLVNGATRMQPSTMLTGQAAGMIAALAAKRQQQPRQIDPKAVQSELLGAGSTLVQRWYSDVPWGTPIWQATQLLTLHRVLDRPGEIDRRAENLGATRAWGVNEPLKPTEFAAALARLRGIARIEGSADKTNGAGAGPVSVATLKEVLTAATPKWVEAIRPSEISNPASLTAGEFAGIAARILLADTGR